MTIQPLRAARTEIAEELADLEENLMATRQELREAIEKVQTCIADCAEVDRLLSLIVQFPGPTPIAIDNRLGRHDRAALREDLRALSRAKAQVIRVTQEIERLEYSRDDSCEALRRLDSVIEAEEAPAQADTRPDFDTPQPAPDTNAPRRRRLAA